MTRKTIPTLAFVAATLFGGAALADKGYVTGHHNMPDEGNNMHFEGAMMGHFQHLDQNDDGKVSQAEIADHDQMVQHFKDMVEDRMGPNR